MISFPADPASWQSTLVLLLPLALAARSKSRTGGRKPPPPAPEQRSSWWLWLLLVGGTVVLIGLGVWASRPPSRQPFQQPSDDAQGQAPLETPGVSKEQFRAQLAQLCPRFAAISGGQAERPSQLAAQLISMECMSRMCEPPAGVDAGEASSLVKSSPLCQEVLPLIRGEPGMATVTRSYRLACPEVAVPWSERPWSPSTELGFYTAVRPCLERICEQMLSPQGIPPKYCTLAADIAEGLGDAGAVARLRQRAKALQALNTAQWQELPPEQREVAETDQDMRVLARRWGEACAQGMSKYCETLAKYCRIEGSPKDVCPTGADAGEALP
ncbi:hypothetical protein F0U62_46385 [Cystobacter fuscus]|uniref:hypothetical protein n=1 Tax=Cystobacter fuscus TaxID=43 RepID=UPI002B2EF311|nr:hypothetical protein F0U62_46385 [Cystobacter fuscus]